MTAGMKLPIKVVSTILSRAKPPGDPLSAAINTVESGTYGNLNGSSLRIISVTTSKFFAVITNALCCTMLMGLDYQKKQPKKLNKKDG